MIIGVLMKRDSVEFSVANKLTLSHSLRKIVHITPIFKHGDRKNCDNYRAISVTSIFSRLFGRIVRDLIRGLEL